MIITFTDKTTNKSANLNIESVEEIEKLLENHYMGTGLETVHFSFPFDTSIQLQLGGEKILVENPFLRLYNNNKSIVVTKDTWDDGLRLCYEMRLNKSNTTYLQNNTMLETLQFFSGINRTKLNVPRLVGNTTQNERAMYFYYYLCFVGVESATKLADRVLNTLVKEEYRDLLVQFIELERRINAVLF